SALYALVGEICCKRNMRWRVFACRCFPILGGDARFFAPPLIGSDYHKNEQQYGSSTTLYSKKNFFLSSFASTDSAVRPSGALGERHRKRDGCVFSPKHSPTRGVSLVSRPKSKGDTQLCKAGGSPRRDSS